MENWASGVIYAISQINFLFDNNRTIEVPVQNGSASVPVDNLTVGDHNITVILDDGEHDKVEENATVSVAPSKDANMVVDVDGAEYGKPAIINVTVNDGEGMPLNGTVDISVDGASPIAVDLVDGKAVLPVEGFNAGNHSVEVKFNNPNYESIIETATLNVAKSDNAKLSVAGDVIIYGENAAVTVKLTVDDSKAIEGIVIVTVDGIDYAVNMTKASQSLSIKGLEPGTYVIKARFIGNDNYNPADANNDAKVIVKPYDKVNIDVSMNEPYIQLMLQQILVFTMLWFTYQR